MTPYYQDDALPLHQRTLLRRGESVSDATSAGLRHFRATRHSEMGGRGGNDQTYLCGGCEFTIVFGVVRHGGWIGPQER